MCILNTVVLCHCDVYTLIITEYTTAGRVYTLCRHVYRLDLCVYTVVGL